jgi:hypothetical protein
MQRMRHIQPENIYAGVNQMAYHLRRIRCRAERCDYFGFARCAAFNRRPRVE